MGFDVQLSSQSMIVELTGWDRVANVRRRIEVDLADTRAVTVQQRADVERLVDHRALGVGTHDGARRPNRRRVGTMMGRSVTGKQFWAVPASDGSHPLVVLDLAAGDFQRIVVAVDNPTEVAAALQRGRCP